MIINLLLMFEIDKKIGKRIELDLWGENKTLFFYMMTLFLLFCFSFVSAILFCASNIGSQGFLALKKKGSPNGLIVLKGRRACFFI